MQRNKIKKLSFIYFLSFIIILFLFCYFRLKPLYFQTVGFTYDQGRDFLKAAELVREKKLTFIGPTTGIQGLFHGAWWYYLLIIPFVLFKGSPIGFYYFNFLIHLVSFLILAFFMYRFFGPLISLLSSFLVATSSYFIFTSIFVGNNIIVLPLFLLFLIAIYLLINHKVLIRYEWHLLLMGMLLGFVNEFEFAFGMFLIPAFIFLAIFLKDLRFFFLKTKNILYFLIGLIIPFIPRILFELKNNFLQTKALFNALFHGSSQNPNSFAGAYQDRVILFFGYFRSLFFNDLSIVLFIFLMILMFIFLAENKVKKIDKAFVFFAALLGMLFFISGIYKDSFFWGNYFEGIQYLFIILLGIYFSINIAQKQIINIILSLILFLLVIVSLKGVIKDFRKVPEKSNLALLSSVVNYIEANEKGSSGYCVKEYTPPVIPFTYNYLFLYNQISKKTPFPNEDWVKDRCWYIIEPDDFKERREKWINENLPRKTSLIKKTKMGDIEVSLYERL